MEEVTARAQSNSLEDAQEICADGTYFPNNLCKFHAISTETVLHFHCKISGYVIERKNGFVAEKPVKPVQCVCRGGRVC